MDQFDDLIEQITVWLYLIKVVRYELTGDGCHECADCFINHRTLLDGKLTLNELAVCAASDAPKSPMVMRGDLKRIRSSKLEADKAVRREQFANRAD